MLRTFFQTLRYPKSNAKFVNFFYKCLLVRSWFYRKCAQLSSTTSESIFFYVFSSLRITQPFLFSINQCCSQDSKFYRSCASHKQWNEHVIRIGTRRYDYRGNRFHASSTSLKPFKPTLSALHCRNHLKGTGEKGVVSHFEHFARDGFQFSQTHNHDGLLINNGATKPIAQPNVTLLF